MGKPAFNSDRREIISTISLSVMCPSRGHSLMDKASITQSLLSGLNSKDNLSFKERKILTYFYNLNT